MSIAAIDNIQMAKRLTNGAISGIEELINNQTITVNKQKVDVNPIIQKNEEKSRVKYHLNKETHDAKLDELSQIKQSKWMEIKQIEKQEDLLKKSAVLSMSKVSKSCGKLWKSEFTQQQIEEIRKIKRKQRQYERSLQKKEKKLEKWLEEKRLQDEELKKQYFAEQCEQRKRELLKQRQQLEKKKKERENNLEVEIKKLKELKAKKLLHHQMTESWKKFQLASQNERSRVLALEKERRRVNSKQIQQHQQKYLQLKKEQQKKREKALQQSRSAHIHLPYVHAHIYYQLQKQEEQKSKQEKMKIQQIENNVAKKKEYGKLVIDQFLPKLKVVRSDSNSADKDKKSTFNVEQFRKLGNEYMKSAHQKITSHHIEKEKSSLKVTEEPGGNSVFYKNYLKDLKAENQKQNRESHHDIVEQTINNSKLTEIEKLHRVRMLLDKDTGVRKTDSDMVETLRNKIRVLNEIMH